MYENNDRISVSLATLEFAENGEGTALMWTEQGAFLVGIDAPGGPKNRIVGTAELLDQLTSYLDSRAPR